VSGDGIVYEQNLGKHTAELVRDIAQYDPDPSWRIVKGTPATAP